MVASYLKRKNNIPERFRKKKRLKRPNVKKEASSSSIVDAGSWSYILHNIYSNTRNILVTKEDIAGLDDILKHQVRLIMKYSGFAERMLSSIIVKYMQRVTCSQKREQCLSEALALLMHVMIVKGGKTELPNKYNGWLRDTVDKIVNLCYRGMVEDCVLYFLIATKEYPALVNNWQRLVDTIEFYKESGHVKPEMMDEIIDADVHLEETTRALSDVENHVSCNRKYLASLVYNVREAHKDYLELRNYIVNAYLKLAVKTVTRMKGAIPQRMLSDAVQEASAAVLEAVRAYPVGSKTSMSSFVIKKAVEYIVNNVLYRINVIKMPEGIQKHLSHYERVKREGGTVNVESLAKNLHEPEHRVAHTLKHMILVDSIHTPDGKDAVYVPDDNSSLEELRELEAKILETRAALERYSPLGSKVAGLRFGIKTMVRDKQLELEFNKGTKENFVLDSLKQIYQGVKKSQKDSPAAVAAEDSTQLGYQPRETLMTEELLKALQIK